MWDPASPYNDLPLLPPPVELESRRVLKATIEARAALAALDQAARLLPNPSVLVSTFPLLEAQASSEIENIVTTEDSLFKFTKDQSEAADPATKEAFRYRAALFEGVEAIRSRPLTFATARRICSVIKHRDMDVRKVPGTRIANPTTQKITYSPPEGQETILDKLSDWAAFVHGDHGLDPLVTMAVTHYQFEAIHPFHDGNGRTGRILNILLLIEARVLEQPILYLSRYIIEHRAEYYRLLNAVTSDGAWEDWTLYMVDAVDQTARSTLTKIANLRSYQAELKDLARQVTRGGRNADFLAVLFEQPYCRISDVVERCQVSRQTAAGWLNDLVAEGVLTDRRVGKIRLFVNGRFLELLTRHDAPVSSFGAALDR